MVSVEFHLLKDGPATRIKPIKKQRKKPTKALPTMLMYSVLNTEEKKKNKTTRHTVNNKAREVN